MSDLPITPEFRIPPGEIEISYARSSGPGGQNVNKVNSKAVLRWDLRGSPALARLPVLRARLLSRLAGSLTTEGELVLSGDRYRDQPRNRADCLEKLQRLLTEAARPPQQRRETKPTRGSLRRVRAGKSHQSEKKSLRKKPRGGDY